jgi:hypothetical protein
LQVTAAKHKIAAIEKELRDFLIYSGQIHFYEDMMRERRRIREARMVAARKKAERNAFWIDISLGAIVLAVGLVVVIGAVGLIIS